MGPRNGSHRSSGRAAGALNHWASSALLGILLCFILVLFYLFITLKKFFGTFIVNDRVQVFFFNLKWAAYCFNTWIEHSPIALVWNDLFLFFFYFLAMAASNTHTSLSQALHSVPVIVAWSMCLNPYATLVYIDEHELPCCQKGKSPSILLSSHCFAL